VGLLLDAPAVEGVLRSVAPQLARSAHAPGAPQALTPVALAVECLRMPLHVELSACELDVASLEDLRIGDVVPVPHRLDAPLLVRDAQEETLFGGYLAQRGGRKALALAAACVAGHPAP
jgi:flagellar motor switch protein FliM